jgi:glucose/arabinose dehydrogenase
MRVLRLVASLGSALALAAAAPTAAGTAERVPTVVASGLRAPTDVEVAPGEAQRLYVVEQRGTIRIALRGRILPRPFLDIRPLVKTSLLEGLFRSHSIRGTRRIHGSTWITSATTAGSRWSSTDRAADVSCRPRRVRSSISTSAATTSGESSSSDRDGKLYIGVGDGGVGADAQNPASPRGKILRIDVDQPDSTSELVALGLRNPWRFSFDRQTGDLFIGDVGADAWEEIDHLPAGTSAVPNYGWNIYEGRQRTGAAARETLPAVTFPLLALRNPKKGCAAVVGGFVYRGRSAPAMRGRYFYGDLCNVSVWSVRLANGRAVDRRRESFTVPGGVASFGEGARGELYAISLNKGKVYRLLG